MTKAVLTCSRLNRQVMGFAGAFILLAFIGSLITGNPLGILLMVAVGLGLLVGGLTGKCALKWLLIKMPWN